MKSDFELGQSMVMRKFSERQCINQWILHYIAIFAIYYRLYFWKQYLVHRYEQMGIGYELSAECVSEIFLAELQCT